MPLPTAIGTCTISGQFMLPDGSPNTGAVVLTAPTELLDTADHVVLAPGTYPAVLAPDGTFTVTVPFNDNPNVAPTGWSYQVTEAVIGGRPPFYVQVSRSLGPTVKYDTLVQAPVPAGPVFPQPWIPLAAIQQKGDLLAGSGPAVVVRIPVGLDGAVLTARASASGGVDWEFAAGGVSSVNSLTGNVVLTAPLVGALAITQNLADLTDDVAARSHLGLGAAATAAIGTTAATVAAGDDSRILGALQKATATTKGDMFVATGAATVVRLPVGADDQLLAGASGQSDGVVWKTVQRDQHTAKLGLVIEPWPIEAVNSIAPGLGLSSGDLICSLGRPTSRTPITRIAMWLTGAGSGPTGPSYVALLDEAGNRLAVSADISSTLTNPANEGTVIEMALTTSVTPDLDTSYYPCVLTQMSSNPKIAGSLAPAGTFQIPAVRGHRPSIFTGGLSSVPALVNISAATTAFAAYWIVALGDPP